MAGMPSLEEAVEFAENPEPRCPCVLLLDTSGSMQGEPIKALNEGLKTFRDTLIKDPLASRRVEVAVISFNNDILFDMLRQTITSRHFFEMTLKNYLYLTNKKT